jgi:hypothetical protein
MQHITKLATTIALLSAVGLSACGAKPSEFNSEEAGNQGVAKLVRVHGVEQVVLTGPAARRVGVQTGAITRLAGRLAIPYAAVLYDPEGHAFTFTSPTRLTFVQRRIKVDYVKGRWAFLRSGPPPGTRVVTVGSAELLGTAHGVDEQY